METEETKTVQNNRRKIKDTKMKDKKTRRHKDTKTNIMHKDTKTKYSMIEDTIAYHPINHKMPAWCTPVLCRVRPVITIITVLFYVITIYYHYLSSGLCYVILQGLRVAQAAVTEHWP